MTDLITPLVSIITKPLKEAPSSGSSLLSTKTPYWAEIYLVISATNGISIYPRPPYFLGVFLQAKCEKCESTEIART